MRVTPQGDTLNSLVICNRDGVQTDPAVVFNGENYIVVWTDGRFPDYRYWVVAARVTPYGAVLDTGICFGNGGDQRESYPDIAFDGNRCFAVWSNFYTPYGVYGRFINSSCQPEDTVVCISVASTHDFVCPKIAHDGVNHLVVFADRPDDYHNVYGQIVSPAGQLLGNKLTIASGDVDQCSHDVVWDGHFYVVVWREGSYDIKGQRIDANGQLIGSSFHICSTAMIFRDYTSIAASDTNYLVTWTEYRNWQYDVYGNVDQSVSIKERNANAVNKRTSASIISGKLILPKDSHCKVYDISGREIRFKQMQAGVYFLEIDGVIRRKIIKVR